MSPWKVILATMVIFACGVITGSLVTHHWNAAAPIAVSVPPTPTGTNKLAMPFPMQRPEFLRRLDRQLDLTPGQHDQIAEIIKESHKRSQVLWDTIAPQMSDELKRVREEIRLVLTPDQRKRWADLARRRRPEAAPLPAPRPPAETSPTNTTL